MVSVYVESPYSQCASECYCVLILLPLPWFYSIDSKLASAQKPNPVYNFKSVHYDIMQPIDSKTVYHNLIHENKFSCPLDDKQEILSNKYMHRFS